MNDIFSVKRFAVYAKKHYVENSRWYLLAIAIAVLLLLIRLLDYNLWGVKESTRLNLFTIKANFSSQLSFFQLIFFILIAKRSANWVHNKMTSLNDFLMPVSSLEKYMFTILNSTIVAYVLTTYVVFLPIAHFAELFYLFDPESGIYYRKSLIALFQSVGGDATKTLDIVDINSMSGDWRVLTYISLICVWGQISIKKGGQLISLLLHGVLFLVVAITSLSILYTSPYVSFLKGVGKEGINDPLSNLTGVDSEVMSQLFSTMDSAVAWLFIPLAIAYLYVIWIKIYKKQVIN